MIKYNIKIYVYVGLAFGFFTWLLLILISNGKIEFTIEALKKIPTAITINLIIWTIFIKWLWKWEIFYGWLVPFQNLSGKWEGEIIPNTQNKISTSIRTNVEIRQTFLNIHVKMKTEEMESNSYSSSFIIDDERGTNQLCYSYTSKPIVSVRERSVIHDGTALLEIIGKPTNKLKGEYWTSRKTTGGIILKRKNI